MTLAVTATHSVSLAWVIKSAKFRSFHITSSRLAATHCGEACLADIAKKFLEAMPPVLKCGSYSMLPKGRHSLGKCLRVDRRGKPRRSAKRQAAEEDEMGSLQTCLPNNPEIKLWARTLNMFQVSKDSPAYYLTSVTKDRLPVFRTSEFAKITCLAIDEARRSGGFLIFAYVIMLEHLHLVTNSSRSSKDTHRFMNGIISRRIIDHLKNEEHTESLRKLRIQERSSGYKYSLWQHHPDTRLLWNEEMLMQRINYTHLNPVRAGLADHPDSWTWSSARIWHKKRAEVEPLEVDMDQIQWRRSV